MSTLYDSLDEGTDLLTLLKRDPSHIKGLLVRTPDKRLVAKEAIDVMFPEGYIDKHLCTMDEHLYTLGVLCFIDPINKKRSLFSIPGMVSLQMTEMTSFTYKEEKYRVLHYKKGDTILTSTEIVSDEKLSYWIYDYFIALGRVPWYMDYMALLKLYDQDPYYVGKTLSPSSQVVEMILGNVGRHPTNETEMYRYALKSLEDIYKMQPVWVPLRNISLGAVDTTSKLLGAYYSDGQSSAMADKSKIISETEQVLRM